MANVRKKGGLRLYKQMVDQPLELCICSASEIIGRGDAVKTAGSAASTGYRGRKVKTVSRISAGDAVYGVVEGVASVNVASSGMNLDITYKPAATTMYLYVRRANNSDIYAITADDAGSTFGDADVGLNANITGNGGGTTITDADTVSGLSTMELDTSTKDTTATLQLKTVGYEPDPTNETGVANQSVLVTINNAEGSGGTGTAGV